MMKRTIFIENDILRITLLIVIAFLTKGEILGRSGHLLQYDGLDTNETNTLVVDSVEQVKKKEPQIINVSEKNKEKWSPDPKKATLWALIPGAGQAYNRKYWKMPIVYAGFGTLSYLIVRYTRQYREWKDAYLFVATDGKHGQHNHYADVYNQTQLQSMKEFYQSNREWCYFFTALFYALQIIDASVDAHLYNFNVTDDLSIRVAPTPQIEPSLKTPLVPTQNVGISFVYSF